MTSHENAPTVIEAQNVSKIFTIRKDNSLKERLVSSARGSVHSETFHALKQVTFTVEAGTTLALIGHNGSGKSTLLKVLGGILDPSEGSVSRRGRIAALLELGAGFHPDLSGRDNVFLNASLLGMTQAQTEAVFDKIVEFAEIEDFIDTQVKFYSSGMYVRLAFAVAVHSDPDILLVDEVLAVGDEAFQRKCMDTIRRFQTEGRTILLVTHNLDQVTDLCDRAVLLNHGELLFDGDPRLAVFQFRELLEANRVRGVEAEAEPEASTASATASAFAPGKDPSEPVVTGGALDVAIDVHAEFLEGNWGCGIQIEDALGRAVLATDSDTLQQRLPEVRGRKTVHFIFDELHLNEGIYFLNVTLADGEGEHVFNKVQACSFSVTSPAGVRGSLYSDIKITA